MRSLIIASAMLASASGLVNTPTGIKTCTTNADCTIYGDSAATCDVTTNKCVCSTGFSYYSGQSQASTHTYAHCFPTTETAAIRGARPAFAVITLEYPSGNCTQISRIKHDWDLATQAVLGISRQTDTSITCGLGINNAARSGIHISVVSKGTVVDLFGSSIAAFDTLIDSRLSTQSKAILTSATRNWWVTDKTGAASYCATPSSNSIIMAYFGHVDTCRAAECVNRFYIGSDGQCIDNTATNDDIATGLLVGIVIGSVAFIVIVVVLIFCFCCRQGSGDNSPDGPDSASSSGSELAKE